MSVLPILEKALDGERISDDEAALLLRSRELVAVGKAGQFALFRRLLAEGPFG